MTSSLSAHWPPGLPRHLTLPQTHVFHNLEVSARRYPDKPFIVFYDTPLTYANFLREAEHIAGHLQHRIKTLIGVSTRVQVGLPDSIAAIPAPDSGMEGGWPATGPAASRSRGAG